MALFHIRLISGDEISGCGLHNKHETRNCVQTNKKQVESGFNDDIRTYRVQIWGAIMSNFEVKITENLT